MKTFGIVALDNELYTLLSAPAPTGNQLAWEDQFEMSAQAYGPLGIYTLYWVFEGDGNAADLECLKYELPRRAELRKLEMSWDRLYDRFRTGESRQDPGKACYWLRLAEDGREVFYREWPVTAPWCEADMAAIRADLSEEGLCEEGLCEDGLWEEGLK